jgi:hypothetical protein
MGINSTLYGANRTTILFGQLCIGLFTINVLSPKINRTNPLTTYKLSLTSMTLESLLAISDTVFCDY